MFLYNNVFISMKNIHEYDYHIIFFIPISFLNEYIVKCYMS